MATKIFEVKEEAADQLDRIRERLNSKTGAEALRRALRIADYIIEQDAKGNIVNIVDPKAKTQSTLVIK